MAITERDETYLMDLTVVLKALREAREEAAQVAQQLQEQAQACRDLDARAAHTLTEAVQRATTTLQQEQARTSERIGAETRRQQEALTQQWQQVVVQAARVQRWLPWKVALLLLGGTLLVNAGGTAWWGWQLATERQELRQATALATDLDRYLRETLYAQLSAPQKQAIEKIYRAHAVPPPSQRLP
jgi:hypothetical protein